MSKFIIDIDELNALYKKVKRSGSGEFTDFNVIKNNIENGLNLDSRVKAKLSNTGFIKDTIISLEASNTNLVDSLGKAISAFSPLSSIKSDIKIEEYISTMSFVNPLTMQDMLPFDITNLDELRKTIAEYSNAKASFTDQNSYYTIPNGDLLKNILNDNNWFIDSIDNDGNAIISGTYIIQVIKLIKEKISTLDNIRDGFNNIYLSGDRYTIDNFMAMCPPSSIFGDYTRDSITVDENGYVDLSLVFEQMGLLEKLSNLENVAEPLLAIEKQYESVKTQQTMLEQMVYGMSIAERLKPYEEVINNEDFLLNIESSDSCYYDEEEGVFILTGKARDLFLYWVNINPESYLNDDGNIEIDPLDMEGLIKHLNVAYVEPFENTGRVLEAGAIELLNILKINEIMPYLTETQKNIFWYHHNIDGIEKAGEYIDALKDYINSEIGKERAYNRVLRFSKDGKVDFPETLELLFKGLKDGTANLLDGALELFYSDGVKSIDQYEQMHLLQILMGDQYTIDNLMKLSTDPSSTEKEIEEFSKFCAVSANLGEGLWRDLAPHSYQIGSTVGYMALPVLLNLALPGTGSALLFAGSMGNAVEQHHQNYGELTWKAYLYGAMTAAAEVVMEKFGGLPGFTPQKIGFFRSLMQEGMQEFFQTFVNGAIDSAHFNTEYDFSTLGPEAIKSLIYGIITAGVFSGPGALKNITIKFMDGYTYTGNIIGALSYMVNNTEVTNYIEEKCLNQVNMDSIELSKYLETILKNNETELIDYIIKNSNIEILAQAVMYLDSNTAGTYLRLYAEINGVSEKESDPFDVKILKEQFAKYGITYDIQEKNGKLYVNPISILMLQINIDSYKTVKNISFEDFTKLVNEGKISEADLKYVEYLAEVSGVDIKEAFNNNPFDFIKGTEYYNRMLSSKYSNSIKKIELMNTMFNNGTYDSKYTINDILFEQIMYKFSTNKADSSSSSVIVSSGYTPRWGKRSIKIGEVDYSSYFPSFDSFITDTGIINYMNKLTGKNINTIEGWIDELTSANPPLKIQCITFQDATEGKGNFLNDWWKYNVGNSSQSTLTTLEGTDINNTGGAFTMVTTFKELAAKYEDYCEYDENTGEFAVTDFEGFGEVVLGGVPLSDASGAYMIEYSIDINSTNISTPSIYNSSSYADAFVSGGQNLSGLTETVVSSIKIDPTGNSSTGVPADSTTGYSTPVVFELDQSVSPTPGEKYYVSNSSGTDTLRIRLIRYKSKL